LQITPIPGLFGLRFVLAIFKSFSIQPPVASDISRNLQPIGWANQGDLLVVNRRSHGMMDVGTR